MVTLAPCIYEVFYVSFLRFTYLQMSPNLSEVRLWEILSKVRLWENHKNVSKFKRSKVVWRFWTFANVFDDFHISFPYLPLMRDENNMNYTTMSGLRLGIVNIIIRNRMRAGVSFHSLHFQFISCHTWLY